MPDEQAAGAHLLDDVGVLVLDAGQRLLEAQAHVAARGRGSPAPARRRARRCRPPWRAGCRRRWSRACPATMPLAASLVAMKQPTGKPPPMPLATAMTSGVMPAHSWANSLPVRPMPHCTSSRTSSRPCSSHSLRRPFRNSVGADAHAALALHRLDHDGGRLRADGLLGRLQVAEGDEIEAGRRLTEALEVLLVAGSGDGGERAAVEGALEGDDAPALGVAVGEVVAPRQLDGALAGLRARIAEEHLVGEGRLAQPLGQPLLAGDAVEVGAVPERVRLLGQRGDELGMRVAQRVDRDAAGEIEVALARAWRRARRPRPWRRRRSGGRRSA